jgi:integrase/recombinase XerC
LIARGDTRDDAPMFTALDFKNEGHRLTGDGIYKIVRASFKAAGIKKVMSPHRVRHSAITTILDETDGNIRKARSLSRHADVRTLMIYDDNRRKDQWQVSEMLAGLLNNES